MNINHAIVIAFSLLIPNPALAQAEDTPISNELYGASDKKSAINQDNADVLQRLYPFYFAYGKDEIKLQVSFKTPIVKTWDLYLGYTQVMFYVFEDHQKEFQDVTYNPELFYRFRPNWNTLSTIDLGIFDHKSNGKPGEVHRSYNQSYVRMNFERQNAHWLTRASVQAQQLYSFETTNTDIQNYIGPLAFTLSFIQLFNGWVDKSELSLQACPGGKFADHWDRGGYQLSYSFRLGGIHLVPAFYLQYYSGYAESLLNYSQRVNAFRAGLVF